MKKNHTVHVFARFFFFLVVNFRNIHKSSDMISQELSKDFMWRRRTDANRKL